MEKAISDRFAKIKDYYPHLVVLDVLSRMRNTLALDDMALFYHPFLFTSFIVYQLQAN